MANLNIPFVLLQPSLCLFEPDLAKSKLIPYQQYTSLPQMNAGYTFGQLQKNSQEINNINENQRFQQNDSQQKYSQIDDTPKNLIVLADKNTGAIILLHEEDFISNKKLQGSSPKMFLKCTNKFIININPKVILIPSISQESGSLINFAFVNSPAQHILCSSTYFLTTLHQDNRIRLWNTNDGRCVMISPRDLLITKALKIKGMKGHPGHILVFGDQGDISIVNVYTMTLLAQMMYEFNGCTDCFYIKKQLVLCDNIGKIFIWKDLSQQSPVKMLRGEHLHKTVNQADSTLFLEMCNNEEQESFKFELESIIGGEDLNLEVGKLKKVLAFNYHSQELIIVVFNFKIETIINRAKKTIYIFDKHQLIFAKFFKTADERELLMCIDQEFNLIIFDAIKFKHDNSNHFPIVTLNLLDNCKVFADDKQKGIEKQEFFKEEIEERQQDQLKNIKDHLKAMFKSNQRCFKYSKSKSLLYTFINTSDQQNTLQKQNLMLSWSMNALIININYNQEIQGQYLPLFISHMQIFPQQIPNCLINFNPIILRNYYNQNQFQFFFTDEKITDNVVFSSINHPCSIIGTNYGRIFMISMFQETEEKVYPVVVIDSHHQSPIKTLFIAYNPSRMTQSAKKNPIANQNIQQQNFEAGGHLISISEDGTIAITNLNSVEIHKQLSGFVINERERRRADSFIDEQNKNKQNKRRNSIQQTFSINNFYYLVKAKSQKVFSKIAFDELSSKVLQVLNLREIHEKMQKSPKEYQFKKKSSPMRKNESENIIEGSGRRSSSGSYPHSDRIDQKRSASSSRFSAQQESFNESLQTTPSYACFGQDGIVFIIVLQNQSIEIEKYSNIDSEPIGIYEDPLQQHIYILGSSLNIYIFNRKSQTLIRKGDFKLAMSLLKIKETVDYLYEHNECFSLQTLNNNAQYDYNTFPKFFQKKNGLMGHGNHKTLDFLSISLNYPMSYNQNSIYKKKNSKCLYDLLQIKSNLLEVKKDTSNVESQKIVLKHINNIFFLGTQITKSDFSDFYFESQNGVLNMTTNDKTFCNSNQQILIVNTQKMIEVMRKKAYKITSRFGKGLKPSLFFQQQDQFFQKEDSKQQQSAFSYMFQNEAAESQIRENNRRSSRKDNIQSSQPPAQLQDSFTCIKWPTRMLSLVHPFNLDETVDENLEQLFGLSLPFLDFRIGLQGIEESFSFVISKEDEYYHANRNSSAKILKLLKLSQFKREEIDNHHINQTPNIMKMQSYDPHRQNDSSGQINSNNQHDQEEPLGRFFNSEYWKVSNYMSTIIPTYFLSIFVSIVEFALDDIKILIQDWLYLLQKINQQKTMLRYNCISLSALSKILLKKNHNISSTARDVIMKPILYTLDIQTLQSLMDEWQALIMDTYNKVKKESKIKQQYGGNVNQGELIKLNNGGSHNNLLNMNNNQSKQSNVVQNSQGSSLQVSMNQQPISFQVIDKNDKGQIQNSQQPQTFYTLGNQSNSNTAQEKGNIITSLQASLQSKYNIPISSQQPIQDKRLINRYFGELEIRGLINLSYFSLYYQNKIDTRIQQRVSKVIAILTREIVEKFSENKTFIHLLTILLQLMSTWMKTNNGNQKNKKVIEDVIKLLLDIFNFYKSPLNKEAFITRLTAENFHLIRPTHSELFLKLTSAKALLEIGGNFTYDFLQFIQIQATTLAEGADYQQNVLEILRYFINGYGENLEHHLIQLTQILLKCLDPNDLPLRKNSHKIISIILSIMVKIFPMVAFHHESQRLAVGTHDGPIAIYDVRTSAKWKILEGHTNNITCLAFDSKGNILVSYSSVDLTVRLWKVGNTGFFSTIMGGTGKCSKEKKLEPLAHNIKNPHQIILQNKAQINSKSNMMGLGPSQNMFNEASDGAEQKNKGNLGFSSSVGSSGSRINKCSIKFILPKEKDVELIREDGKKIEIRLSK